MSGCEREEHEELIVPVVAVVCVVVMLHCDVNDGVRPRRFLLRIEGALAVEPPKCEVAELEGPVVIMKEDGDEGLLVPEIDDHEDDCAFVAFAPTVCTGKGGADANLSRRCNVLSLCFCGKLEGTSAVARRSLGGVLGGIKFPVEIGNDEDKGATNVGVTGELEVI